MVEIHVSPSGSDAGDGSASAPLAGLAVARDRARAVRRDAPGAVLTVLVHDGLYRLNEPLELGPEDGGSSAAPVVWRAAPAAHPVLSGSVPVDHWRECRVLPAGVKASRLLEADVSRWVKRGQPINCLWRGGALLPRAALPFHTRDEQHWTDPWHFGFDPALLDPRADHTAAELHLTPNHCFVDNFLSVQSLDCAAGRGVTTQRGTYALTSHMGWGLIEGFCALENVPEALRQPGDWLYLPDERRLLLVPFPDDAAPTIEMPLLDEVLVIRGHDDARHWARHIVIQGLAFTGCRRAVWPEDRQAVQHDWALYDFSDALVRLCGVEHVDIRNCLFEKSGGAGVRADLHAVDVVIRHNEMRELGGGGVILCGDGPGGRDETHHHTVAANAIHACGLLKRDAAGILLNQCGHSVVADNLLHHLPYAGICLVSGREAGFGQEPPADGADGGGRIAAAFYAQCPSDPVHRTGRFACRFNRVEHNEIHHVMEVLGDGNGIYVSGTGPGNVVRRNYVHDITARGCQSAIRLDDHQWSTLVTENVVWRCSGGITLKDVNEIENNIIVECDRWGSILVRRAPSFGAAVRRNICVQYRRRMTLDGEMPPFYDSGGIGGRLEEPVMDANLFYCPDEPEAAARFLEAMRRRGQEAQSVVMNPGFADLEAGDFRLADDAPAVHVGFRPIPFWGPRLAPGREKPAAG